MSTLRKRKNTLLIDRLAMVSAVLMPFSAAPQIIKIWTLKSAAGISPLSWGVAIMLNIPMLLYGITHKERPIIILNALWMLAYSGILLGALMYG